MKLLIKMVLCWVALPVFAVLGIFSVKYRRLAKESLECLFMTATFRKCQSGMDDRIKSQITGRLLKFSPKSARFFYKNYKVISFVILVVFLWSAYASGTAIYNYAVHGNCNGPDSDGFCVLDVDDGEDQLVSCEDENIMENVSEEGFADMYEPCPCEE